MLTDAEFAYFNLLCGRGGDKPERRVCHSQACSLWLAPTQAKPKGDDRAVRRQIIRDFWRGDLHTGEGQHRERDRTLVVPTPASCRGLTRRRVHRRGIRPGIADTRR